MVTAIVMVGAAPHSSDPAAWVSGAQRAAARDLLAQLSQQPQIEQIILVSPDSADLTTAGATDYVRSAAETPHFGKTVSELVERFSLAKLLYFGGGSAPLLTDEMLAEVLARLTTAQQLVITNNQFASDWAGVAPAQAIRGREERLPRDNMVGWVLSTEATLPLHTFPANAGSRLDIDTPTDLLTLKIHPHTKPHLRQYLANLPLDTSRLVSILETLARRASRVFIAGRLGPDAWAALNKVSHCWLRVVSEERGMVSSGRALRGEVYSLLAEHIALAGMDTFFASLANWADAALIDTRVLLAHHNLTPPRSTRFASDLGLLAPIEDAWLAEFTAKALACPIPIVLGGHGLLSGDLLACSEILASWQSLPHKW